MQESSNDGEAQDADKPDVKTSEIRKEVALVSDVDELKIETSTSEISKEEADFFDEPKIEMSKTRKEKVQVSEMSIEISEVPKEEAQASSRIRKAETEKSAPNSTPSLKMEEEVLKVPKDDGPLIVHFENVTVHVPDTGCQCCASSCMISLSRFGQEHLGMSVDYVSSFDAIRDVSGCIREGETCLVLGPSGSGKSTLLRALCARLTENDELSGGIFINGSRLEERHYQGWRAISSYVSATDNEHTPVLTVAETFRFAAECTSDGFRTREEIEANVQQMLDLLGLAHVADTVVGDENLRGVSGGQKRRVTVGEMLMNRHSKFMCLDNITDGLASTDSLELISNISRACKKFGVAAMITLLQPSDDIVNQFDKLLVLGDGGDMKYFGPLNRALLRTFFEEDDTVSTSATAGENGGICDLVLGQNAPTNKAKAKKANIFKSSTLYKELMDALSELRLFPLSSDNTYLERILPKEEYHTSFWYQFKVIGYRRRKLIFRNAITYMRPSVAIFFGIIVGSVFSVLKQDAMGALGRSGYLYLSCFLVFMLSTAVVIPEYFRERKTVFKHRSAEYYSGRVDYVTKMIWDFPLSVIEATIVAFVSYFWVGMNPGVNHFVTFWFTLIGLECVGQATARLLCSTIRVQLTAKTLTAMLVFICGAVSGFMPTYDEIPRIFRWMSWINPVAYAFEAIMINEFNGRTMYGLVITDPNDATITIGELSGNTWLDNQALPRVAWGDPTSIIAFDIIMLFIFGFLFDALGCSLIETTRGLYHNQVRKPQPKVAHTAASTAIELSINSDSPKQRSSIMVATDNEEKEWPQSLTAIDLKYKVFVGSSLKCNLQSIFGPCLAKIAKTKTEEATEKREITLLNGITAQFKRGKMTALMGQSGAGKTTLMDVIAGYKTGGLITGDVLIDGCPKKDSLWKKISGYAEQNDILNPYLSVLETLQFTADCRLPTDADKQEIITSILQLMNLESYTTMLVGRELLDEGLPKHARKRLTIANQLINKPKILFLDEPTSGLGNNAAALVVGAIRRSTDAMGLITLATIHQPSSKIFETFDELLLVAKGGRVAYMGPLGYRSQYVLEHFAKLEGKGASSSCNPADYVLNVLDNSDADVAVSTFASSSLRSELQADIKFSQEHPVDCPISNNLFEGNTTMQELVFLTKRHFICQWRNPSYSIMRLSVSVGASLFLGILFFQIQPTLNGAIFTIAAMNFFVFMLSIPMQGAIVPLVEDRAVLYREVVSGTYGRISYAIGQIIADVAFHALNTILMFLSFYYLVGFRTEAEYVGYFILMLFLANWVASSVGECFAYASPNEETASGFSGLSTILSVIFMGFLITVRFMPNGWVWANWSNLFRYIMQGLVTNQLEGQEYKIDLGLTSSTSERALSRNDGKNASAIIFGPGTIPEDDNVAAEVSRLISLVLTTGPGTNNKTEGFFDDGGSFSSWVNCMVANKCLVDPILSTFISCNIFNFPKGPPCEEQFETLTSGLNVTQCFQESISIDLFQEESNSDQLDIVKCMLRSILPDVNISEILTGISTVVDDLYQIVMIVLDVIQSGIVLPANVILWFFGWGRFEDGEFIAPYKWHYCMTAVVVILICVETLKLIAVRFIVWTKR